MNQECLAPRARIIPHILEGWWKRWIRRRRRCAALRLALASIVLLIWPAAASSAEGGSSPSSSPFAKGRQSVSLLGGYGIGLPIGVGKGTDLEDVRMWAVLPSWGIGLTDPVGGDAWYRGNLEVVIEGALLFNTEPTSGFAGGATVNLRYNFLRAGRFVPYVESGAGLADLNFDLDRQADGLNFFLQVGLGARWLLTDRLALLGGWRFHHISNANSSVPNNGLDSSLFVAGMTVFFD